VILAAALVVLGGVAVAALVLVAVALSDGNDASNTASRSTAPPTTSYSLPTVATTLPTTSTAPPTTIPTVKVPNLVGMNLARAKAILADQGLRATIRYRSTARYPAGRVIFSVTQDGSPCRSRQQDHRGDRQGAAITANDRTTAYFCAAEL